MKGKTMKRMGFPEGKIRGLAREGVDILAERGMDEDSVAAVLKKVADSPAEYTEDEVLGKIAAAMVSLNSARSSHEERDTPAPYSRWGTDIEPSAIVQMEQACRLTVSVRGALMPDAHHGYGLPIGGVLAVRNAVIPFAVGMDIACRMKMSVFDISHSELFSDMDRFKTAIRSGTLFGTGAAFRGSERMNHSVMDEDWSFSGFVSAQKDRAWGQLGTSGSGNHFAEFGVLEVKSGDLGLGEGKYLAFLTHSGSRGVGAEIAKHYSSVAKRKHPGLPDELSALAWLDLDTEEGQEYWQAMNLMGLFSSANHQIIHRKIASLLGAEVIADVENHHNFAWIEEHDGEQLVVHRKGATPADTGILGVIPGSMTAPGYIVKGKGCGESLNSASHGAGRKMSRTAALKAFTKRNLEDALKAAGVVLMSGGLDEVPMAYKDIDAVMAEQADLVDIVARFDPVLVKMAD